MKYAERTDKLLKFNNPIFLFIKKIKYLTHLGQIWTQQTTSKVNESAHEAVVHCAAQIKAEKKNKERIAGERKKKWEETE